MKRINLCLKRIIDIIGSLVGLVILSPVFLVIALFIKMDSPGPVFFVQDRLGLRGRTFRIIKFRTMVVNAENIGDGLRVKSERDPRITKVGRILRATSLDELPQLINVLKGDMSLVGPRPPATYHPYDGYAKYPEWAKKRFEMRPGITGLAQVRLRNSAPWTERIEMDVKYVEQYHIAKDFWILFWTIRRVFTKENIYA